MNGLQVNLPKHPWSSKVHKATSPLVTSHQSPNSLTCMHARIRPGLSTTHCFSLKTKTVRSQQNKWMKIRSINLFSWFLCVHPLPRPTQQRSDPSVGFCITVPQRHCPNLGLLLILHQDHRLNFYFYFIFFV